LSTTKKYPTDISAIWAGWLAEVAGANQAKFDAAVKAAEIGGPESRLFKIEIGVDARLRLTI